MKVGRIKVSRWRIADRSPLPTLVLYLRFGRWVIEIRNGEGIKQ